MLADGIGILRTPGWTAANFLANAKTFPAFYAWFALPMNTWWLNPLNSWGITLIGVALVLGIGVRPAAWAGVLMMLLYYFPHYTLPWLPNHGFIVDQHLIFAAAFFLVAVFPESYLFGLGTLLSRTFLGRIPIIGELL